MDSDDDGAYGYDIPDEGGSAGFRIKPSHVLGADNSSNDEDDGEGGRQMMGSSSDDDDGSNDDGTNHHFSYGAYGKRKRKQRNNGKDSNISEKERNLYGVFYDSSEEDEAGGRRHGGKKSRTASRHFDKTQNRMAGLAFVKASSSSVAEGKEKASEDKDGDVKKTLSSRPTPSWLEENTNDPPKEEAIHSAVGNIDLNGSVNDGEDDEVPNEEEMKAMHDREVRFKELVARANTSTNPISLSSMGTNNKKTKIEKPPRIEEPVNNQRRDGDDETRGFGGIGFNHKTDIRSDDDQDVSEMPINGSGLGFVSSQKSKFESQKSKETTFARSGSVYNETEFEDNGDRQNLQSSFATGGAGLGLGMARQRGLGSASANLESDELSKSMSRSQGVGLGMGSGMGSSFPSLYQTMSMGMNGNSMSNSHTMKKRDPTLGTWEKHTKGIGMRLLQKMGYEGSGGLGAKKKLKAEGTGTDDQKVKSGDGEKQAETTFRQSSMSIPSNNGEEGAIKKGISRPVEVVVRPAGLGLGYGSFKEATQLKVNRQIEAEVRGLDPSKVESSKMESEKKKNSKEDGVFDGVPKSLLPSTQSLLNQSADRWRKGKANKKTKRKIVMYQDILNESSSDGPEKMKIIDMRGPSAVAAPMVDHEPKSASTTQSHSSSPAAVPLGEELLHNVTLLLNTHESQLRTSSYMVKSTQRKVESLEAEGTEMAQRREVITGRMNKIQLALNAIDEAEKLVEKISSMDIALPDTLQIAMCSTAKLIAKLYGNFSREERISLKFDAMLIPSIVKPIMNIFTSVLEPLQMDLSWVTHLSVTGISELCNAVGSDDEAYALREIIFVTSIVPWIKDSLNSSRWDPVMNAEVGLGLYDALLTSVHNFSSNDELNSHSEEDDILEEVINDSIIQNAIYPKLLRAVSHWKPQSGNEKRLINPMHLWIMPWLPHLNNESMLGTLLVDIRRKLKSTLSFLSKSQSDDMAFVRSCIHALLPWRNLYPEHALFDLTSDSVTPRFARAMARINIVMSTMEQDWEQIHVLFEYFEQGLMSVDDFLCLIDGEVLPVWSTALYSTLKQDSSHVDIAKFFYVSWKKKLFEQVAQTPTKSSNPQIILQSDSIVCRYFYAGLEMMRAAFESNEEVLQSLEPPNPADCNYRISLMLRGKDKKLHHEPSSVQVKVRVHRARDGGNIASFQEVVSDFARHHDIAFHPPKTGSKSMKDGKPVFMFGDHPVYFDKNVLYARRGGDWQPISLEHLAQMC